MQISYTLIVALMYVTILSFGIATLMGSISTIINRNNTIGVSKVHLNWIVIILIFHFNMTWHAVFLTNIENWTYYAFLLIVLGPTLGYFVASLLAPVPGPAKSEDEYFGDFVTIKNQLLTLFIGLQVWTILADLLLGREMTGSGYINIGLCLVGAILLFSNNRKYHLYGILAVWFLLLTTVYLRSIQMIN